MTPEDVARRYANSRTGFRLVTYQEVGLPLWRMNLRCLFLAHRPLPPIEEFVLKTIDSGLVTAEEVSRFLGLDERVTFGALATLVSDDYLGTGLAEPNVANFALTNKGRQTLEESEMITAEERIAQLHYDGLARRFVNIGNVPLYRPRELQDLGTQEIPPFPSDPPGAEGIAVADVDRVIAELAAAAEIKRDLIAVQGIEGRRERVFRKAVALIFEAEAGVEVQVAFAIDGRLSDEHEQKFAAAEGVRKLGIVQALREKAEAVAESLLAPDILEQVAPDEEVAALRQTTDILKDVVDEAQKKVETSDTEPERDSARTQLIEASTKLAETEAALAQLVVRHLEVYEHPPLLRQALEEAVERLMIISPWIRAGVVDDEFLRRLEAALQRGVKVYIGYGSGADENAYERDRQAEAKLRHLSERYEDFLIVRLGDTHAKVLLLDDRFVIVTSFNWLSFRGDPHRPFRDERGVLVAIPENIEEIFESFLGRMLAEPDGA